MSASIKVRRAEKQDADFLAWVLLSSSRGHLNRGVWDLIIGADDQGCLEYLRRLTTAEPRSLCHYDSFWVAEVDGHPQAALSTFEHAAGGWATVAEAQSAVRRDLGWTERDLEASSNRMAPLWACFLPDVGADWGIENIATRPECRRLGLVSVLLDQATREGRECGCKLVQTTTYIGNSAVHAALAKAGFQVSDEKRSEVTMTALGTPGFVRFLRALS